MEAFLDTVMARTQGLAAREDAHAAEWRQHGIPWDGCIHRSVRVNSMHLATLYMSRQVPDGSGPGSLATVLAPFEAQISSCLSLQSA